MSLGNRLKKQAAPAAAVPATAPAAVETPQLVAVPDPTPAAAPVAKKSAGFGGKPADAAGGTGKYITLAGINA